MEPICPAGLYQLLRADHTQLSIGDVARHSAPRSHNRVTPDFHRRDQGAVRSNKRALANHGLIFEIAIIVAGDRARTDVRFCADLDIAQIGQVIGLCAFVQMRLLGFDEIADLGLFLEHCAGTQSGEGADFGSAGDAGAFDMAIGADFNIVRQR